MKSVAFYTLGCKVNQVETEQLKEEFALRGYQVVDYPESADIYVVNTCTVTHVSDRKSRAILRRIAKNNPKSLIIATGCMAQISAQQLQEIKGVNLIVGNRDKDKIADLIEGLEIEKPSCLVMNDPISSENKLKPIIYSCTHSRSRAFIKIQDGCKNFCSYCIVPFTRGPIRSKLPQDILQEIQQLISLGYKELVLTGIHTGHYGADLKDWDLAKIINEIIEKIPGEYRLRLSSIEPLEFNENLLRVLKNREKICHHFHIPLQSGSDKILKAMKRKYYRDYYADLINKLAMGMPDAAIAADVMVGFPGETEKDFCDTYDLLNSLPIYDLHVFKYSMRPGTLAAGFKDQVGENIKNWRSEKLIELAKKKKDSFIARFIGKSLECLVEKRLADNTYLALSDNYLEVVFESKQDLRGNLAEIKLVNYEENVIKGKIFFP